MKFNICVSQVVPFSWKFHRLTLKHNPAIYHWFWFTFGMTNEDKTP